MSLSAEERRAVVEFRIEKAFRAYERAKDILTGRFFDLSADLTMKPRQSLVLEF